MDLHHINIKAPIELLEKEKQFFCNILSLEEGCRPNFSKAGFWLYSKGIPIVHLTESNHHYFSEKQGHFDHVAFQSKGVNLFIELLEAHGVKYSSVYLPDIDMSQIFIVSPTGIRVEINFANEKYRKVS